MYSRIALVCGFIAIAGFFSPRWVGYAALGLLFGFVIAFVIRHLRSSVSFRLLFIPFLAMLCGLVVVLTVNRQSIRQASLSRSIEVGYTASIALLPDISEWKIREEFLFPNIESIPLMDILSNDEESRTGAGSALTEEVERQLKRDNWISIGFLGRNQQFRRDRSIKADSDLICATTIHSIPVGMVRYLELSERSISLVPDTNSVITITTPKHVVASTFPEFKSRQDLLSDGQELFTIPLDVSRRYRDECRIAVLHPLLRWKLGTIIGGFSLWSGIQWIVLALFAVFSDQIKETVLKPIVMPLFPSKKQSDGDEEKGNVVSKADKSCGDSSGNLQDAKSPPPGYG